MKTKFILLTALVSVSFFSSAQFFDKIKSEGEKAVNQATGGSGTSTLTNDEVVRGLKEALTNGAKSSVDRGSLADGFYKNAKLFIPFPPEAQKMKQKLSSMGFDKKVTAFEESMNRAAEGAAKDAFDVFSGAITGMSVSDGFAILKGSDSSATHYLRENTTTQLTQKFTPIVKAAMDKVNVTAYWTPLATTYNKIPGVTKQNPDLEAYVTQKAINGLMILISEQEAKIRQDPAAQVTDLLKKVFGGGK